MIEFIDLKAQQVRLKQKIEAWDNQYQSIYVDD